MIDYKYTYLIGSLIALIVWTFFFTYRKDTRREMLTLSLLFGIVGIFAEYLYIQDWWRPLTITGTAIGIEDFLFGFSVGGVFAVAYEEIFKKRLKIKKKTKKQNIKRDIQFIFSIILILFIFAIIYLISGINSFVLTILIFLTGIFIILIKRKDLIKDSLFSGLIALGLSVVVYQIIYAITPGFFDEFWLYENIGRITLLKIPLEELVWFFLAGAFIGPLYEYWKGAELKDINK
ncbi:MAG: lycopene cyclase domain-containing protein [Nanoarchaeota archaeon]|nr:lycopene cyclase domain-containing protein [Nanoarchaeota archaeon]